MKIIELMVNWMEGWGNSPDWYALVDKTEDFYTPKARVWEGPREGCWRAEIGDAVAYLSHDGSAKNAKGFSGSEFKLYMKGSGKKVVLAGPWSGNAAWCNALYPDRDPCVEIAVQDRAKEWQTPWGGTKLAVNIKISAVIAYLRDHDFIVQQLKGGDISKEPKRITGKIRAGWQKYTPSDKRGLFLPHYESGKLKNPDHTLIQEVDRAGGA